MSAPNSTITLHPEMHREIDDSLQTSRLTRSAMLSVVAVSSARSSSSQRRPPAIDATKVARFSERIGRACCGDIPSGRRIAILRSVSLRRVIPPRQFCDQMSLSDNIIQKVLAFRAPLERYCPRDRFDSDCVLGTQFESSQPHHALSVQRRFPGSLRIAPNWRGFVGAFCHRKLSFGFQGPFRHLCLCPQNPVSRKRRLWFVEIPFECG
jgi:hypothetical protein